MAGRRTPVPDEPALGTQAISRALKVLGILRQSPNDLGVTELARTLSLNTSTMMSFPMWRLRSICAHDGLALLASSR